MIKRSLESMASTWLAGLFLLLPLALTVAVVVWIASILNRLVGPGSLIGGLFSKVGYSLSEDSGLACFLGTLMLIGAIHVLGAVAQLGLKRPLKAMTDAILRRVPLVAAFACDRGHRRVLSRRRGPRVHASDRCGALGSTVSPWPGP